MVLALYAGIGVATFVFQSWVRSSQCTGTAVCTISFVKGAVWSVVWPASWVVYIAGMK